MKKILDSVHGNINIPSKYVSDFVDTIYFQRLRRIEQTSCRAVFPSARHDRFIHSLGVFHLGQKFVEAIKRNNSREVQDRGSEFPENAKKIFTSYILACLLHDIGHSPFSHTFENFYEKENSLNKELITTIPSKDFEEDLSKAPDMKPHEKMSGLIAAKVFGDKIEENGGDVELVVRMIIGCPFGNEDEYSFENAVIQLIHGDIIDADRLDYALRDVWAAGYDASSINIQRLIDNTSIERGDDNIYHVCYNSKALNEIESVLNVKNFQNLYIFSHHKIVYEQKILIEAMKSASELHWYGEISEDNSNREDALGLTCNVHSMFVPVKCKKSEYSICHPMDDDFIAMMKSAPDDYFIKQWFSRRYELIPLWKSKAEFYFLFGKILDESIDNIQKNAILEWLGNGVKEAIKEAFNLTDKDLLVVNQKIKYSELDPDQILIKIGKEMVPLTSLAHDGIGATGFKAPFSYIYIKRDKVERKSCIKFIQEKISEMIKSENLSINEL